MNVDHGASLSSDARRCSSSKESTGTGKASSENRLTKAPMQELGLRVLVPNLDHSPRDESLLDVDLGATGIRSYPHFVNPTALIGLGAIPCITWRHCRSTSGMSWLEDPQMLPKALPNARIMRFEYDSIWMSKTAVIKPSTEELARSLLSQLKGKREVSDVWYHRWLWRDGLIETLIGIVRIDPLYFLGIVIIQKAQYVRIVSNIS